MFNFSTLFTGEYVAGAFDASIETDASNGRVNSLFRDALLGAYGLELPASPKAAVGFINQFVGSEKMPTVGKGPGARVGARAVAQALHALGEALHAGGAAKGLPALAALSPWADPVALAVASAARAEKRAAKPAIVAETAPDTDTAKAAREALALVKASALAGLFTASECDAMATLFTTCQRAPETVTKATMAKTKAKATT